MKRYLKNKSFIIGLILISALGLMMLVSLFYLPYEPTAMDVANKLKFGLPGHLLGTDQFGRDILSRIMKGTQISMLVGFVVVLFGVTVGTCIGAAAGYYGGKVDEVIMKIIDTQMAFPGVLLALMLIAVFGNGIGNTILALSIMAVPRFARMSRSGFVKYREFDFVRAAKVRGASDLRIIFIHILPNLFQELIVTMTLSFASAVMAEAGLSYLGLGIQPPNPSFGKMLSEAQNFFLQAPWYVMIPAVLLCCLIIGFNLIGDGIREVNER